MSISSLPSFWLFKWMSPVVIFTTVKIAKHSNNNWICLNNKKAECQDGFLFFHVWFLLCFFLFLLFFSPFFPFFLIEKSMAEKTVGNAKWFFPCFHWLLRKSWLCSSSPAFHGAPDWLPRSPSGSVQHLHRIGRFDMMEEKTGRRCAPSKSHLGASIFCLLSLIFSPFSCLLLEPYSVVSIEVSWFFSYSFLQALSYTFPTSISSFSSVHTRQIISERLCIERRGRKAPINVSLQPATACIQMLQISTSEKDISCDAHHLRWSLKKKISDWFLYGDTLLPPPAF